MNPIAGWLKLIGTPKQAKKLRMLIARIPQAEYKQILVTDNTGMPAAYLHQRVPAMCPTKLLYGDKESQAIYLDPEYRPALDAWDTGEVTAADIRLLCIKIETGQVKNG